MVEVLLAVALSVETDWAAIVRPAMKQVPRLEILVAGHETPGVCSGVLLNRDAGFVLTAAHCIPPGEPHTYSLTVNGRHAVFARANRLLDLAVVRFNPKDEQQMELAGESPDVGADIAVIGFLLGSKTVHVQFGRIAAKRSDDGGLVIDGVALPGDSGGAIIDGAGKLVGMTNAYYRGTAIGLAVPVEMVREFVESYLPTPKK
jgi:serine protease DegQ